MTRVLSLRNNPGSHCTKRGCGKTFLATPSNIIIEGKLENYSLVLEELDRLALRIIFNHKHINARCDILGNY